MKRTRPVAYISLILLTVFLLPLLWGCAKQEYPVASPEIPEGWEVVSVDGNLTHLKLKEGSDAYYWVNDLFAYQLNEDGTIVTDLQIAGNAEKKPLKPDQNGNIYFIFYFGHFYAQKLDGAYKLVEPTQEPRELDITLRIQYTGAGDIFGNTGEYDFLSERWVLDELDQYNKVSFVSAGNKYYDEPQASVGLTQAVMVPIPYDKLDAVEDDWTSLLFHTYSATMKHTIDDAYHPLLAYKGNVYFQAEDLDMTANPLFTDWVGILSLALLLCSLVVMILTAIFKKNCFLHLIPIIIGVLYNIAAMCYISAFPYHPNLKGEGMREFLLIGLFIVIGIVLLAIRLFLGWIIKMIGKALKKKKEPPSSEAPQ